MSDGEELIIPIEQIQSQNNLGIQPFAHNSVSPVIVGTIGNAGSYMLRAKGHYVYWSITMTIPATRFVGTCSTRDMTTGLNNGSTSVSGFSGKIYAAKIIGHLYRSTIQGIAYNGIVPVAKTKNLYITWTAR